MLLSSHQHIKIKGLAVAVPSVRIPVESYYPIFGEENVQKFSEMAGVKQVTRAINEQTASDLGYEAARELLLTKEIDKKKIGVLVFVSQKPDYRSPATSFVLQQRLGLDKDVMCLDINLACSGFVYGLQTTLSLLTNSTKQHALLITADTSYKTLSPEDRTMIMLFGDSGSAVLLEKNISYKETFQFGLRSNGAKFKSIITPAGAFRNMDLPNKVETWSDGINRSDYNTHMKGMDVFGFSITDVPALLKDFLSTTGKAVEDFDVFALHQANLYILKQISRKLKIPFEKIPVSIDRFGNNSSNSVPLVLCDHFQGKEEKLKVFISGFGAGLSWACGAIEIDTKDILPLITSDAYYQEGKI
ncbi:3-oxoacyl-ACP synthase III family protein [Shivajiella indica]|uniref:3-oxoacyl-ACP synthase III family protein n=1 Tax=Shivajiella indica TaxID=872115 RepID=A0ABW5B7H1_9BACT